MKNKKCVASILIIAMLFTMFSFFSGARIYDEQMIAAEEITMKLFNYD